MHIPDGPLSVSAIGIGILGGGAVLAAAGTAWGLRRLDYERVPQVALLSAAFFVASLIHVPLGGASVHLVLVGLIGLVLGWAAFPAILIGLTLQAVFFPGLGGFTTLGVNTLVMALPAVASYAMFHRMARSASQTAALVAGFAAGSLAVLLGAVLLAAVLAAVGKEFERLAQAVLLAHIPVAVVEGLVTSSAVLFLRKVRPELLEAPWVPAAWEASDA
jgi:cobalt/nickel transport system permease protein